GRGLVRRLEWGRGILLLLDILDILDDVDSTTLELAVKEIGLEHVELVQVHQFVEIGAEDRSVRLGRLDQQLDVLLSEEVLDLDRHPAPCYMPLSPDPQTHAPRDTLRRSVRRQPPEQALGSRSCEGC